MSSSDISCLCSLFIIETSLFHFKCADESVIKMLGLLTVSPWPKHQTKTFPIGWCCLNTIHKSESVTAGNKLLTFSLKLLLSIPAVN